ncbi:MAG: biopolymer transporter ExbB [Halobacteriovoraceae bacterium]|nr:biopolymer transporter ExbB [Halobacteriovoraceae bacterium]|tara:strand:- start:48703 stop:49236 length:534 start_codon:yes stop_codon:yes gene_type:complete
MRLFDYINQGGPIMYVLLLANIIGIAIILWKVFVVMDAKKNMSAIIADIKAKFNELGAVKDASMSVQILKDEIQTRVHNLEGGLTTIKIIATVAPLLGLLGTVMGILSSFKVISEQGLANPSVFAGGISMALLTTVGGLIVAIPHFVGYNYLSGLLDDLEIRLEKTTIKEVFGAKDV